MAPQTAGQGNAVADKVAGTPGQTALADERKAVRGPSRFVMLEIPRSSYFGAKLAPIKGRRRENPAPEDSVTDG